MAGEKSVRSVYGVDWSPRYGAACPGCSLKGKSHGNTRVMPWDGNTRKRYHHCAKCGINFLSLEIDITIEAVGRNDFPIVRERDMWME